MKHFKLIITGKPQTKQRPRVTKRGTYTPQETIDYEERLKWEFKIQVKNWIVEAGQIDLTINAYMPIPKSETKAFKEQCKNDTEEHLKRPDIDNIAKIVADGLNNVAWLDDSQICDFHSKKRYSANPRLEIFCKLI